MLQPNVRLLSFIPFLCYFIEPVLIVVRFPYFSIPKFFQNVSQKREDFKQPEDSSNLNVISIPHFKIETKGNFVSFYVANKTCIC